MRRMSLTAQIFLGMVLGLIAGLLIGEPIGKLKFLGDIFLRLILMSVVPLVFTAVTVAIARMDLRRLGRLGGKVILFYLCTTAIAITVGLIAANIAQPGVGIKAPAEMKPPAEVPKLALTDVFVGMVPRNIVDSMAKMEMLPVVVFAIFLGAGLSLLGKRGESVVDFMESLRDAMIHVVSMAMYFAPIGVFALMGWVTGTLGAAVLIPVAKFLITVILAIIVQTLVVVSLTVWIFARVSPLQFYKRCAEVAMVAFTTCSSAVSLPLAMETAQRKLGVGKRVGDFSLPLGAVINSDGMCIYQAVASLLIAQFFGVHFGIADQLRLLLLILLIGLGTAPIPGGGLVLLSVVLAGMGWPVEGVALIAGVDRLADMFRTALNVLDDLSGSVAVAAWENDLDRDVFYGRKEAPAVTPGTGVTA